MNKEYEDLVNRLQDNHPYIRNAITETSDGNGILDETKVINRNNAINKNFYTQIVFPKNLSNVLTAILNETINKNHEVPFYLFGHKEGNEIIISRIMLPNFEDTQLYVADNGHSSKHEWIIPCMEEIKRNNLNSNVVIFQGHSHIPNMYGSNNWSIGDLRAIEYFQDAGYPVTHTTLLTPNAGLKYLECDFQHNNIGYISSRAVSREGLIGLVDLVTYTKENNQIKYDKYGNPIPKYHFQPTPNHLQEQDEM